MKPTSPFDCKSYRECTIYTLVGSSLIALTAAVLAVLIGVPEAKVEDLMTKMSVPWFLFWYLWCRISSQLKILPLDHLSSDKNPS